MPTSYSLTDVGRKRGSNQDYVFTSDIPLGALPCLYIIADGMGGHLAGEFASKYSVDTVVNYIDESAQSDPTDLFDGAFHYANDEILRLAQEDEERRGMGTTLIAATIIENRLYVSNVGDSRLYIIGNHMSQITTDHSLVGEMVRTGSITLEDARVHPNRNVITRAIGAEKTLLVDHEEIPVAEDDLILLCTDGLTTMLDDATIEGILSRAGALEDKVTALIAAANEAGGRDNISVILIDPARIGVGAPKAASLPSKLVDRSAE